jgi:hypothetical protein
MRGRESCAPRRRRTSSGSGVCVGELVAVTVCEPEEAVGACCWPREGRRCVGRDLGEAGAVGWDMVRTGFMEAW